MERSGETAPACYIIGMATDIYAAADFYGTRRGGVAALLLRERLAALWPSLARQSVLGMGYAAPYLRLWREESERCIALTPAQLGAARWPAGAANLACTAEEDALPFADMSFDRILLIHGLEAADNARRMLREVWRVLKDDGRLLIVVPNRSGMWAHLEGTPFGQGQPYSPGQVGRLLAAAMFRVERRDTALYLPPGHARLLLRSARLWENAGRRLVPGLAGVTISEAVKDMYAAVPMAKPARRKLVLVETA
ncbi:MAG TPA: methyltransferase domain-containing protein [Acetobacteraceae bacterium]|jgi:SAM-dependent methyltransferase|nr:methyltransferase domain-containing protein [Acetobacteraceae bacterium]